MAVITASIDNLEWTRGYVKNAVEAQKNFVTNTTRLVEDMAKDWSGTDYIQYKIQWQQITGAGSNIAVTDEVLKKYEDLLGSVIKEYREAVQRARTRFADIRGGLPPNITVQDFSIDTQKMRGHAQTIEGLIKRINATQNKANFLKIKIFSLFDLFDQEEQARTKRISQLVQSGYLEEARIKLTRIKDALNETADDFDATDRRLQTKEEEFTRYLNATPYGRDYSDVSGEVAELLTALGPELLEFYEYLLAYNFIDVASDGTVTYKWKEIKEFVANLSDDDEGAYNALALLYMNLEDVKDIEEFLKAFMVKTGDFESENLMNHIEFPKEYTRWKFDTRKLSHVQRYIDLYSGLLLAEYKAVENVAAADYPNLSAQEFLSLKRDWLTSLGEQRRELLQKNALLSMVTQYGDFKDKPQSVPFIEALGLSDLTGQAGSEPSITITQNADGSYVFGYTYTEMYFGPAPYGGVSVTINHEAPGSITVSQGVSSEDVIPETGKTIKAYFSEKYDFDFTKATDEKLMAYLGKKVELELKNQFTSLAAKAMGEGAGNFAKGFVKYVSFAEDMYGVMYDVEKKRLEYNQNVQEASALATLLEKTDYCEKLKLDSVTITTGNPAHTSIVCYEGPGTERVLENINAYIYWQEENFNLADYGFEYGRTEITINDVYQNPDKINNLIYGTEDSKGQPLSHGMSEMDMKAVFTTEKYEDVLKLEKP